MFNFVLFVKCFSLVTCYFIALLTSLIHRPVTRYIDPVQKAVIKMLVATFPITSKNTKANLRDAIFKGEFDSYTVFVQYYINTYETAEIVAGRDQFFFLIRA